MGLALAAAPRWTVPRTLLAHLRLPFQLLLTPFFTWGWLLSGGGWTPSLALAFVAFHVFLYGGATAFNSYYDRDEGPIGGLERPPPVVPQLLPFSLAFKAVGWLLAAAVNLPFFLLYSSWVVFSVAYSYPGVRLKARTLASLASIGLFQGAIAFLAGWAAARGEIASAWGREGSLGALSAMLLLFGLYPLTQLFQVDEDRARGDRTIAVVWGLRRSFGFALGCQALGGLVMIALVGEHFGALDAVVMGMGVLGQLALLADWARRYESNATLANYRRTMRMNSLSASGAMAYFLFRLAYP